MKKFSAFLSEAEKSFAARDAEKLGLKHVGYGNYADPRGNVTHRSVDGKLVKMSPEEIKRQQNGSTQDTGEAPAAKDAGSISCLLYTSPSPRDKRQSRMPSSA